MSTADVPQKIAILGGGMASLATAFELTSQSDWQTRYDITVYQLGWRLGGKGASGRNMTPLGDCGPNYRIEEHGIHLWFGFYDNSFNLIQRCYSELGRSLGDPLAIWEEAFKPQNFLIIQENVNGEWIPWTFDFPMNNRVPGQGEDYFVDLWVYIGKVIDYIHDLFMDTSFARPGGTSSQPPNLSPRGLLDWLRLPLEGSPLHLIQAIIEELAEDLRSSKLLSLGGTFLYMAKKLLNALPHPAMRSQEHKSIILWLLRRFIEWFWEEVSELIEGDTAARRLFIIADLAIANVIGLIEDDVITKGFASIDKYDYREWISRHGARNQITLESAPVRGIYDLGFAYVDGDLEKPLYAAGATLRGMMLAFFEYKGAFLWKMQAGMGDVVFAPIYQVLKRRGVKFKFFHQVKNLGLSANQRQIETIEIGRQVNLKQGDYEPLVNVKNLPCWPSEPLYDQIENGERLRGVNLESFYTTWEDVETLTLKVGEDFDQVVFGISIGAIPFLCPELLATSAKWRAMVTNIKTVQTQAVQIWQKPDNAGLGWQYWKKAAPLVAAYIGPYDNWTDMSHLLIREAWSSDSFPNNISYFCGVLKGPDEPPPASAHNFPSQSLGQAKQDALTMMQQSTPPIWPNTITATGYNWNLLVDPEEREGIDRFDAQYLRANVDPTERYVQSVPGSTQFRLKTDESGFTNLYLTGDWILNGFNSGAVESATISGMQTSRAISGYPQHIYGENF